MACWCHSPYCIGLLLGCVPSPCLACLYFGGFSHHPIRSWYACPPSVFIITGGPWWPMANTPSLFWRNQLARHFFSLLLGEILFSGRSQWPSEMLSSWRFVGLEFLPNSCHSSLWLSNINGPVVFLFQWKVIDKSLVMMINYISCLVLDLSNSLVIIVHYSRLRR